MAFIGTPLDTRNTFQSLVGKRFSGDGSETEFTLDVAPSSVLDIEVFVGNVRQDPNSAYTLSGTTLTFTGAPPSGTNNIYVVHQAKAVGTIGIPDDTISARTLVTLDNSADHVLIEDATDGELKKALIPAATSATDSFTISGSTPTLTIGDAGAEDTKIVFDGNAQDFHIGLDDSADDLVIGLGSTLGTTTHMSFDENGAILKPLQPCFMATIDYNGGNNCTGDGTTVILGSSDATVTERFDQGSDFSSGTFTAPVTGRYMIGGVLTMINVASNHTEARVDLEASNRTIYQRFNPNNYKTSQGPNGMGYSFGTLLDADANDTIKLKFYLNGGSKDADTQSDGNLFIYLVA